MANCKCKTQNCGCKDTGLLTPPPCDPINCPGPEACSETFNGDCVIYMGATLPDLYINQGDNLADIILKSIYMAYNPDCYRYIQIFKYTTIDSTSVSFEWEGTNGPGYRIYYSTDNSNWSFGSTINGNSGSITGLTSNTTYYFKLGALQYEATPCYSLTLQIKTL